MLYGLVLLKNRQQREKASKFFDDLVPQYPNALLPMQAIAWLRFEWKRAYQSGLAELTELVSKVPRPKKPGDPYGEAELQVFYWVGQLREFAAVTVEEGKRPPADSLAALDAAVARHGPDAQRSYEEGREKSRAIDDEFNKKIAAAESEGAAIKMKYDRRSVVQFVDFPYVQAAQQILNGLDQ